MRAEVLTRDGYRCQIGDQGCLGVASVADHTTPIARLGIARRDANDPALLQAACSECHDRKTKREAADGLRAHHARRRARLRLPQQPHPGA
ncbi:HNH endonuclease [Mycolicibacillus parakoreensis]|nr:HNH endonuclease [Mycolicibacillus parakoreensis]